MKLFSAIVIALGFSSRVFAGSSGVIDPTEVTIPLLNGGVFVGITGAYLEAAGSDGSNDFLASVNSVTQSELKNVGLDYGWGWGVNGGVIFAGTANDINLNYFHFDDDGTASAVAPPGGIIDTNILNIKHHAEYDLNQIDLTAGQYINVGCRLRLHPNVGLRWDNIEYKFGGVFTQTNQNPALPNGNVTFSEKSEFEGIGPLVGIDASYYLGLGFSIVGHFNSALAVGDNEPKSDATTLNFVNPTTIQTIQGVFRANNTRRLITMTDAKLGADYLYLFNNSQNSDLSLEVGYQVSHYHNAVDRLSVSPDGIVQARNTSDFGLHGIYAALTFHA